MSIVHHSFSSLYEPWVTEISFRHYWDRLLTYHHYECQMIASIANFCSHWGLYLRRTVLNLRPNRLFIAEDGKLVMRDAAGVGPLTPPSAIQDRMAGLAFAWLYSVQPRLDQLTYFKTCCQFFSKVQDGLVESGTVYFSK